MKIAVIGAGAMGCFYGTYLSQNHDVYLIAHTQEQANLLNEMGISMTINSEKKHFNIPVYTSWDNIGSMDVVIIAVKSMVTQSAIQENLALVSKDTLVLTIQNGSGNDEDISKYVDSSNVIVGVTSYNCVNMESGVFRHSAKGITMVGSSAADLEKLELVVSLLNEAGIEAIVSENINKIIWSKLMLNTTINTFATILNCKPNHMLKSGYGWDYVKMVVKEVVDVAEKDGVHFDYQEALDWVHETCLAMGDGFPSMLQDRRNKRLTEIDKINGIVVKKAEKYGIAAPCNRLIVDIIHCMEELY